MPKRSGPIQVWAPGVPDSRISRLGGMFREANRRNIPDETFWTLENVRYYLGEYTSRYGLAKINSGDGAGSNVCQIGVGEIIPPEGVLSADKLLIWEDSASTTSSSYIYAPAVSSTPIEMIGISSGEAPGQGGENRAWVYNGELLRTDASDNPGDIRTTSFVLSNGTIQASAGPARFATPTSLDVVWAVEFPHLSALTDVNNPALWLVATNGSGNAGVYIWDGERLHTVATDANAVLGPTSGFTPANNTSAFMFVYHESIYIWIGNPSPSASNYATLHKYDGSTWSTVSLPTLSSQDEFFPKDSVIYSGDGSIYIIGLGWSAGDSRVMIFSFDGTTMAEETDATVDTGGQNSTFEGGFSIIEHSGELFWTWNNTGGGATTYIGNYDGVTWTTQLKDITATLSGAGSDNVAILRKFNDEVLMLVQPDGATASLWQADDKTDLSSTWTKISDLTASKQYLSMRVFKGI